CARVNDDRNRGKQLLREGAPVAPPVPFGFQGGAGGGPSRLFAKPAFQSGLAGATRQVPDVSMLADPFTGTEIIITLDNQLLVGVVGGTSLATPMFFGVMAIAAQKNGHVSDWARPRRCFTTCRPAR